MYYLLVWTLSCDAPKEMSLSQELTSAAGTGLTASGDVPLSTLVELRDAMRVFVSERGWEKFHTPRNLLVSRTPPRKTRHETPNPDSTWTPTKTAGARGRGGRARRDLPVGGRAGAWPPNIFSRENVRRALHLCARARGAGPVSCSPLASPIAANTSARSSPTCCSSSCA